jgi:hypothetical protein
MDHAYAHKSDLGLAGPDELIPVIVLSETYEALWNGPDTAVTEEVVARVAFRGGEADVRADLLVEAGS